jgi:hypothetical protein
VTFPSKALLGSIYSTGHGSIVVSSGNPSEIYYPHHARPSPTDNRYLYTARLFIEPDVLYMGFGADAGDLRWPAGVAPLSVQTKSAGSGQWEVEVVSASGVKFDLAHPGNRLWADLNGQGVVSVNGSTVNVEGTRKRGEIQVVYQRARANATDAWAEVVQFRRVEEGNVVGTTITI